MLYSRNFYHLICYIYIKPYYIFASRFSLLNVLRIYKERMALHWNVWKLGNKYWKRLLFFGRLISFPFYIEAFVRKDALPLGTFSKYTWHITNILQVKQILDTPEVRVYFYNSGRAERREGSKCGKCVSTSSLSYKTPKRILFFILRDYSEIFMAL